MGDNEGFNQVNDQAKKMNEALKYTDGDADKAREMLGGKYKDIKVVKGRFAIDDAELYGVFLIFLKTDNETVSKILLYVFSEKEIYDKVKDDDKWNLFYKNINDYLNGVDLSEVDDLVFHLADSAKGYDLFTYANDLDNDAIEDILIENFRKYYNLPHIDCSVEIDELSSIELVESGIGVESYVRKKKKAAAPAQDQTPEIEKNYDLKINAKVIVSPVKGKYVNDIEVGEIIKLIPLKDDPLSKKVANAQKTIDSEGKIKFIRGKLKEKVKLEDGGYILYCLPANNVLAKVIEEENVKIELYTGEKSSKQKEESGKSNLMVYVALLLGLVVCSVLAIVLLV